MVEILIGKILSLALIMLMGWVLVKRGVLRSQESEGISKLSMYLITPCMILSAFQVDYSDEVKNGMFLALFAAAVIHLILIVLNGILKKLLRLDAVEQVSVMYSNAGNLTIPLVTAILGKEWVIYTSAYIVVQLMLLWSHGKGTLCGEKGFDLKKIFLNVNMISIGIGVVLFFTRVRVPGLIQDTLDSIGDMIGPLAMLVSGMLLGSMDLRKLLSYKRVWLIAALRLVLIPLIMLPLLKFSPLATLTADAGSVLLVTLLAVITPSASVITQLAQVYEKDAQYACAINVVTILSCIVTMPIMVMLYQL